MTDQRFERFRRLRARPALRSLVQETRLSAAQLVYPVFARDGERVVEPIAAMPGQNRLSVDEIERRAKEWADAGIGGVLVFGVADRKDATGSAAADPNGAAQRAVRALKTSAPDLVVATDVCLCAYTDHGHCGIFDGHGVDNDATLPRLADFAVSLADAGADIVAPSAMMDGQVAAIRSALDAAGRADTAIMAYAAKYASAFYGPFRDAADSAPQSGDRRGYQLDPANAREGLAEIAADIEEGADIVMVKPALAYLDVIRAARDRFDVPLAAYNVSGEYSMIVSAAECGWVDRRAVALESLMAMSRAGADILITYFALEVSQWLK